MGQSIVKTLFLLFSLLLTVRAESKKITFLTHDIRPFVYKENNKFVGFGVEIITEMMNMVNYKNDFKYVPFNRALNTVQTQNNFAMFIVSRRPEREKTLKWVGPLISSGVYFYKKKENKTKINNLEDLKKFKAIGVARGNADHFYLKNKGYKNLLPVNTHDQLIRMLYLDRIDITPISEVVIDAIITKRGFDFNLIEKTNVKLYDSHLYLVFSKNIPESIITQWQSALIQLKKSEKYKRTYLKYIKKKFPPKA